MAQGTGSGTGGPTRGAVLAALGAFVICVASVAQAHALQYITGHITVLEPTYLPDKIALQMDVGNTACPPGKWLSWVQTRTRDTQSVYATMLSALLAGKKVDFVINDNDVTCEGQFFHIYP
jgi:hypothetical protein